MQYKFAENVDALQPSAIREILKFTSMPGVISFAAGNPAPEAFPVDTIRKISAELFEKTRFWRCSITSRRDTRNSAIC